MGQVLDCIYYEVVDPMQDLEGKIPHGVHGFCFYKGKMVVVYSEKKKYWSQPGPKKFLDKNRGFNRAVITI